LLHPFLLLLLRERSGHGYDLIDRLAGMGVPDVEPGHAYRVLRDMERRRLVASVWVAAGGGPARRRYELTAEGRAELEDWACRLAQLERVIGGCLARLARVRAARTVSTSPGTHVPGTHVPGTQALGTQMHAAQAPRRGSGPSESGVPR
jgi:poly-beta-hydroxybutyrate-responsive repressor